MASTRKPSGALILAAVTQTIPPISPQWSRPDDAERQARLDAMKRRATALLAVALVVFVVASIYEPQFAWLGYVRATAEASLVGGLADWFAVTALFRHPLGDRKSTRLNSSHVATSYAVFCLKKKNNEQSSS